MTLFFRQVSTGVRRKFCFCQFWTLFGVLLNAFAAGFVTHFTQSNLELRHYNADPDKWWLDTYAMPATISGALASSFLADSCGRRKSFILSLIPGLLGWTILYLTQNITAFNFGRIMCFISNGATSTLGTIIIGEYASPNKRGLFFVLNITVLLMGKLVASMLHHTDYGSVCILALMCQLASLLVATTWLESPYWLVTRGMYEKCEETLFLLRGTNAESTRELESLKKYTKYASVEATGVVLCFFRKFTKQNFVRPFIVMFFGTILLEASGRHYVSFYASKIVAELDCGGRLNYLSSVCIDSVILISSLFALILIKVLSRRTLLFTTGVLSSIFLFITSLCLFLVSNELLSNDYTGMYVFLFVAYFVLANTGCAVIPLILMGEIFPLEHRAVGSAVSQVLLSGGFILSVNATPKLLNSTHLYGTLGIYCVLQTISLVVYYFILPETKDRSLQEIQDNCGDTDEGELQIQEDKIDEKNQMIYNLNGSSVYGPHNAQLFDTYGYRP